MNNQDIYSWIQSEETKFETNEIQVGSNWYFNFRNHVQIIFHLMHGVFFTGENNWLRAFKQVMRPLMELSIWTEDLEVKDVIIYIENELGRVLAFLVKKYHDEVYVVEHDLDTLFDEITESDIAYGGALVQRGVKRPECIPLQSVAFCDQTDMLGGPVAFKHYFSPSKLREMSKYGWGKESNGATITIDDLIDLAEETKDTPGALNENKNQVPGKSIEVYIVRGTLPDKDEKENELAIIALYTDKDTRKQGVTLYRKKEEEGALKFLVSKKVYNRALGYSDGEALLPVQIWTNFAHIHKMNIVEAAGKVPLVTDDPTFTQKQKVQEMENLEVLSIDDGKRITAIQTAFPANYEMFQSCINELYESGQFNVAGYDSLRGKEESSGTTFRGQDQLIQQGRGPHDRRKGQRAKFIESIYMDWIIPDIKREILKGKKFLATLSSEEMMWVADRLTTNQVNKRIKKMVLAGKLVTKQEQDMMMQVFKQDFLKQGNKQLLEILKDEFDDVEIKIKVNIAGKQKNLGLLSDKFFSIIQSAMANPQGFQMAMQNPALARAFENVLEYSNVPIPDFYSLINSQPVLSPMQPTAESPELVTETT